jgi:hypothetical protein
VAYKNASYAEVNRDLLAAVDKLPTEKQYKETVKKERRETVPQQFKHAIKVGILKLQGFNEKEYDTKHYVNVQIPAKPHSKVRTGSKSVNDTEETIWLEWNEEFDLLDFEVQDDLLFCVFKETPSGDEMVAKHLMPYHEFAQRNLKRELALQHPHSRHRLDIKMSVTVRVCLVSELEHAIDTYRSIMRERLLKIGASGKDIDETLPSHLQFSSAADVVKAALRSYHKQADATSKVYPFPGKKDPPEEEVDESAIMRNKMYVTRLDDVDPNRLWVSSKNKEEEEKANVAISPSATSMAAKSTSVTEAPPAEVPQVRVEFVFIVKGDDTQALKFQTRPLGIVFSEKMPISIWKVKPGSHAAKLGVQTGWTIESIDGTNITGMSFDAANNVMKEQLSKLPTESDGPIKPDDDDDDRL